MNTLVVVAFTLTARLVVAFFGGLSASAPGTFVLRATDFITIPFGILPINTPYGGVLDGDGALSILVVMGVEWLLTRVRARMSVDA